MRPTYLCFLVAVFFCSSPAVFAQKQVVKKMLSPTGTWVTNYPKSSFNKLMPGLKYLPQTAAVALPGARPELAISLQKQLKKSLLANLQQQNKKMSSLLHTSWSLLYNEQVGLLSNINAYWNELLFGVHQSYFGTASYNFQTPEAFRYNILLLERNLQQQLLAFVELKTQMTEQINPTNKKLFAFPGTLPHLLTHTSHVNGADVYDNALRGLLNHYQPLKMLQKLTSEEELYKQILDFAYSRGKFPFQPEVAIRMLGLAYSTNAERQALYQTLDSEGCQVLEAWGWTHKDMRQLMDQYDKTSLLDLQNPNPIPALQQHYQALEQWEKYWVQRQQREHKATSIIIGALPTLH